MRAALLTMGLGTALLACGDEPRCGALARCDVRLPSCQQAALVYAACLRDRGEAPTLTIQVETKTREQFVAESVASAQAADTPRTRTLRRGLALFGLSPRASTAESEARTASRFVGATYRSNPPRIVIIDEGYSLSSGYYTTGLVHEMVHALQDAAGELTAAPQQYDRDVAESAIIEGEATLLQDEAWAAGNELSFDELPYERALRSYRLRGLSLYGAAREDVYGSVYARFTYAWGASYLWPLRQRAGGAALVEAHAEKPVSTYAVMTGDVAQREQRPNDLGDQAVPTWPGLTRVVTMHLGRFVYASFRELRPNGWRLPRDEHFVADTLSIFESADGTVAAAWRLRFDEATQLTDDALQQLASDRALLAQRAGNDVWFLTAESATLLSSMPPSPSFEPAPPTDTTFDQPPPASRQLACPLHPPPQ